MTTWWMKLGGNLPVGHDALLFSMSATGSCICQDTVGHEVSLGTLGKTLPLPPPPHLLIFLLHTHTPTVPAGLPPSPVRFPVTMARCLLRNGGPPLLPRGRGTAGILWITFLHKKTIPGPAQTDSNFSTRLWAWQAWPMCLAIGLLINCYMIYFVGIGIRYPVYSYIYYWILWVQVGHCALPIFLVSAYNQKVIRCSRLINQVQSMDTSELALLVDNRERSTLRSVLYYTVKTCFWAVMCVLFRGHIMWLTVGDTSLHASVGISHVPVNCTRLVMVT